MTTQLKIDKQCFACGGSGRVQLFEDGIDVGKECVVCVGLGEISPETIDVTEMMIELDWIKRKIKKILNKLEIPEE